MNRSSYSVMALESAAAKLAGKARDTADALQDVHGPTCEGLEIEVCAMVLRAERWCLGTAELPVADRWSILCRGIFRVIALQWASCLVDVESRCDVPECLELMREQRSIFLALADWAYRVEAK